MARVGGMIAPYIADLVCILLSDSNFNHKQNIAFS
jgi:hypothetical protein